MSLTTIPTANGDPFGTLRANKAINNRLPNINRENPINGEKFQVKQPLSSAVISNKEKHLIDYRGIPATQLEVNGNGSHMSGMDEDLVITDELLQLLEDFKTKSYSMKEMEMLFENWRRKAAIYEEQDEKDDIQSKVSLVMTIRKISTDTL